MAAPHPRACSGGPVVLAGFLVAAALSTLLQGCATSGDVAPPPELASSGWSDPATLAPVADFDAYVSGVTEELRKHRLPFDPSVADAELNLVAPFRMPPGPTCKPGERRGIAVLVHGLSDSAFAMRDVAASLARQCFESRVLLLPGHGTRPADLMVVDHEDWLGHVQAAVSQAARESDFVVMAGFSLGAALALTVAADSPGEVDAVIGLSPAYRIRSTLLARQARWIAAFRPWLNAGTQVEFARYAAMPTRGIASTMATLGRMDARVDGRGALRVPWLVVQSEDDEVVDVAGNRQFFTANAGDARSVLLNYFSAAPTPTPASGDRVVWLPAADEPFRVVGLSHLSVHIAPDNPHYGVTGSYRNCGSVPFRQEHEILACRKAERVWYGVSGQSPPAGEAGARATFNPHYADLERRIGRFLDTVDPRREDRVVSQ
ncbi:MAG: alpha/beta hydrolase [Betaproteobacteria bacterium]